MSKKQKTSNKTIENLIDLIRVKKIDPYIFLNTMKIILGDQNPRKNILKLLHYKDLALEYEHSASFKPFFDSVSVLSCKIHHIKIFTPNNKKLFKMRQDRLH